MPITFTVGPLNAITSRAIKTKILAREYDEMESWIRPTSSCSQAWEAPLVVGEDIMLRLGQFRRLEQAC